jgi:hypothetical protein
MISERLYEVVLVAVVATIVLAFGIAELGEFVRESREFALRSDLAKMRTAITFYYSRHNRYPASLEEAASEGLGGNITLILRSVDEHGRARDPFGRRYFYSPVTGEVSSRTPGYENY